jgi:hypothetical protein
LTAQFALNFSNGQAIVPVNFNVSATAVGATHQIPQQTALSPVGSLSGTVTAQAGANAAIVDLEVCYMPSSNFSTALGGTELCNTEHLVRSVGTVRITTNSLVSGSVGASYSATLQATGGSAAYQWSIASGSLPAGLSLNPSTGAITGTPTTAGTFNFTARVTSGALSNDKSLNLVVVATQPPGDCLDIRIETNSQAGQHAGITCARNLLIGGTNSSLTIHVSLPQLTRITNGFAVGLSGEQLPGGLSVPNLTTINGGTFSMSLLTILDLPAIAHSVRRGSTNGDIEITSAPDLVTVRLGSISLIEGSLIIQNNPKLTDISGISCGARITGDVIIRNNAQLTQSAALAKANCMIVEGQVIVENNKP